MIIVKTYCVDLCVYCILYLYTATCDKWILHSLLFYMWDVWKYKWNVYNDKNAQLFCWWTGISNSTTSPDIFIFDIIFDRFLFFHPFLQRNKSSNRKCFPFYRIQSESKLFVTSHISCVYEFICNWTQIIGFGHTICMCISLLYIYVHLIWMVCFWMAWYSWFCCFFFTLHSTMNTEYWIHCSTFQVNFIFLLLTDTVISKRNKQPAKNTHNQIGLQFKT